MTYNKGIHDIFFFNSDNFYETEIARQCFNIVEVFVIAMNVEGRVTMINNKALRLLGYTRSEIINKHWIEMLAEESHKNKLKEFQLKILNGESSRFQNIKHFFKTNDGSKLIIEGNHIPIKNKKNEIIGFIVSGKDVTDYIGTQNELKKSVKLLRQLAGNIPDINLFLFDRTLKIIISEGAELKNRGYEPNKFEGKNVQDAFEEQPRKALVPLFRSAIEGNEISTEFKNNDESYMVWVFPLTNDNDEVYAGMAITQNISREKSVATKMRKAKEQAEQASLEKSEFVANISHEIRTPLNAIIGFTEQIKKTQTSDKQKEFLNIISSSAEHLLALVNDVLSLSKIESGKFTFENKPFRIRKVVHSVFQALKMKALQKGINFNYFIDEKLDFPVSGDATRLRQVLINMLNNSIKFTDNGYIEIKCFPQKKRDNYIDIRFDIVDTGIGISDEKKEKIFDNFQQADSSFTKKYGGTGLGLSICKKIIELQGGRITVSSQVGIGSQFTFVLPFEVSNIDAIEKPEYESVNPHVLKNLNVLLVDDDSVNRMLATEILNGLECKTDQAADGHEALKLIADNKYDIILLDIHMPGISGIEVAQKVRGKNGMNKKTPIVAVTAAVFKEETDKFEEAGIDDHLLKPFKEIELYNKLCHNTGKTPDNSHINIQTNREKNEATGQHPEQTQLYDLSSLMDLSNGNNKFIVKMLETFIVNVHDYIDRLKTNLNKKDWEKVGEAAHKMLPSYKHLNVNSLTDDIMQIKVKTLVEPNHETVPRLVNKVIDISEQLIGQLEKEKEAFSK